MRPRSPQPTPRMRACMLAIQELTDAASGRSPFGIELRARLGISGGGELERLLAGLQERGFIARAKFRKRGITILKRIEP